MNSTSTLPDEARLRGLLDGTLSEAEQAEVLALVERHPEWQQALDRLAAGAQTWEAAAQQLREPPLFADAALRSAIAGMAPPTAACDQPASADASGKPSFLKPVGDPQFLGSFGQYLVEKVVGRGGFGIVLKAFDPQLRRIVALKVLAPHLTGSATACARFTREAHAAAAVVHDHVITIHSVGDQPLPHLVMQYVAGQSLQEKLDATGPLGIKEVLRIGMQTAAGLAAAHKQGEVHRDIKPANILLENGVERVKITDFGLARAADDASMTQSGTVAGTPQYMSPEQARGETVDFRSDLFSLGSVLYAMCAGHPPFRATTTMGVIKRVCEDRPRPIREINPEIPDWVAAIIDKLMAKRPEERFASAQEVADLLGQCLLHVQQPTANPSPVVGPVGLAGPVNQEAAAPQLSMEGSRADDALLDCARRAVREPAIGLVITGILNWIALALILIFLSNFLHRNIFADAWWIIPVIAVLGLGSGLMVVGGLKLLRLESQFLVTLAGIAAMLVGPGYFVGFPIGLWALVVLQRPEVKEAFALIRRRHWPGLADAPAELPEEGEWSCRCLTCGYVAPLHKWGGVRIGAASRGKRSVLWCPSCRWFRWMKIEQFLAKDAPPVRRPDAVPQNLMEPSQQGVLASLALILLVLLLLIAIPLTFGLLAVGAYFFYSTGSPPSARFDRMGGNSQPIGQVNIDCPDTRFQVRIHRIGGDDQVSGPAHVVKHNESMRALPGEYIAAVLWEGIEVRSEQFTVPADGTPVTYRVPRGGTLRFIAGPGDRDLGFALNHITGQTIWDWPNRQTFVIPEGLVHVDLRRPSDDGSWHILTANYFDIVAGQETILRVREKDVELVTSADEDAVIALHRESLKAVEEKYATGREPLQAVIDAKLKLHQARIEWAEKAGRAAEALSIRQEIVKAAQEKVKAVEALFRSGIVTQVAVNEAKVSLVKEQERHKEAEAKVKELERTPGAQTAESSPPAGATALPRDGTTINDLVLPSMLTFSASRSSGPEGAYGHVSGAVLYLGKSPVLCFGLNQRPGEKSRFTYLILMKTYADFSTPLGGGVEVNSKADDADVKIKLPLAKEPLEIEYHFLADATTHRLLSESLRIGPHECKDEAPRVFLADVTEAGFTLTPVRISLPAIAPDLADEDNSTWPATLLAAVGELQSKTPEVEAFLQGSAKTTGD